MVVFCRIEFVQRGNLCHDLLLPEVSCIEFFDKSFGDGSLLLIVIEDGRTILCTFIGILLVQCRWIVDGEEDLQDFSVRDLGRIESYLNCLRVAGTVATDLLVGGINGGAACVAGNHLLSTPSTSMKIASMHQKQPPARVATSDIPLWVIACSLVRISAQCHLYNSVYQWAAGHH